MTMWLRARTPATLIARFILGLIFAVAAIPKITSPGVFRADVASYHLLPSGLVGPFSIAVPWIEALVALYLLTGLFLRFTAVVAAVMLTMFIVALGISIAHGNTAHNCGCLPTSGAIGSLPIVQWLSGGDTIGPFDVIRDLVFFALTGIVFWGDRGALSIDGLLFGRTGGTAADYDDDEEYEPAPPPAATAPVAAPRRK